MQRRFLLWLGMLAVLMMTTAVYWPGLHGDFVFDDFPNILEDKRIHIHTLQFDALGSAALSSDKLKRPLSRATFAVNHYFTGLDPFYFKLTNLLIHLLNGLLVFWLARSIYQAYFLRHALAEVPDIRQRAGLAALAAAALWLLAPINLTGVLYIVQRMASMSMTFMLLGLGLYTAARLNQVRDPARRCWPVLLVVFLLCGPLAALAKENGVLLYPLLLIIEFWFFGFAALRSRQDRWTLVLLYIVCLLLPIIAFFVYTAVNPAWIVNGYLQREFSFSERVLTEARVLWLYLLLIFIPTNQALSLYHDDIALSQSLVDPISTLFAVAGIVILIVFALRGWKRYPLASFAVAWFLLSHSLESTIIPLEIAHEHRNYLASLGPYLLLAGVFFHPRATHYLRSSLRFLSLLLIMAGFTTVTLNRSLQWGDHATFMAMMAVHKPNSERTQQSAGRMYAKLAYHGYADSDKAFEHLERARQLDRSTINPEVSLIMVAGLFDRVVEPSWIEGIKGKLGSKPLSPSDVAALKQLVVCTENDKCDMPVEQLGEVLAIAANNRFSSANAGRLADVWTIRASYYIDILGDYAKAERAFRQAAKLKPHHPQYLINMSKFYLAFNQEDKARSWYERAKKADNLGVYAADIEKLRESMGR